MSTPAKSWLRGVSLAKLDFLDESEKPDFLGDFYGLISARAYSLFEEFGGIHGYDVSQWLEAEKELASFPEVEQSGDMFSTTIPLAGMSSKSFKIYAAEDQAIISANNDKGEKNSQVGHAHRGVHLIYYLVRWPERVSSESYKAEIRDGKLALTARRSSLDKTEHAAEATSEKK